MNWDTITICLYIFIVPLLLGAVIRFLIRKKSKAYILTIITALMAVVAWYITQNPPVLGSELYGIRMFQTASFSIGSFFSGMIVSRRKI